MLTILHGDAITKLRELPDESVQCCVTSPPFFGLRDYGADLQLGLEKTPEEYVAKLVEVFREARRILANDGTLWLNLGDSYANDDGKWGGHTGGKHARVLHCSPIGRNKRYTGLKPKDLIGIPWLVAFALRADGWWLRSDIIWAKPNPMPESVTDRPTKSHEYIFLLTKSARYFYDAVAIAERAEYYDPRIDNGFIPARLERDQIGSPSRGGGPLCIRKPRNDRFGGNKHNGETTKHSDGSVFSRCDFRNKRTVWTVTTKRYPEAHFATYPPDLIKPCILAGSKPGDVVLDPFAGSGTTGQVALELGRGAILIDLNAKYLPLIEQRTNVTAGLALTWGAGTNPAPT